MAREMGGGGLAWHTGMEGGLAHRGQGQRRPIADEGVREGEGVSDGGAVSDQQVVMSTWESPPGGTACPSKP
mgnify:CR=1 FL=1